MMRQGTRSLLGPLTGFTPPESHTVAAVPSKPKSTTVSDGSSMNSTDAMLSLPFSASQSVQSIG